MRVANVSRDLRSRQVVRLKPENASAHDLPEEIELEFDGKCLVFNGKVGDTIKIALKEEHSLRIRRYNLGCNPRAR
jgi:hypothetical protein